jgi:NADH-quinone oxidoreductase subunit N
VNLSLLIPEIIIAITAISIILLDLFIQRKGWLTIISLAGIAGAFIGALCLTQEPSQIICNGLLSLDSMALFFKMFFLALTFLIILVSSDYVVRFNRFHGEFHALILLASLGMMLMASSADLISVFLSLELTTISFYALTGFLKNRQSTEAALKYVLLGSINSALLLYGFSLIFGFTGHTHLSDIAIALQSLSISNLTANPGLLLGLILIIAGFGFKIASVPFYMWAPDVYEGAPTPVTLFLSTASKLAGFSVLLRVMLTVFIQPAAISHDWGIIIALISAIGMTLGNLLAIPQNNIKRMLAYSGIAQTGYMLTALAALGIAGVVDSTTLSSLLFFMVTFAMAEVCVFAAVIIASETLNSDTIGDYAGLKKRAPALTVAITIGLFSLMGMPPTAGFMAKFYLFSEVAAAGLTWLVIIAVLNSVISAFYYLKVIRIMWMENPEQIKTLRASAAPGFVLAIASIGIILFGLLPVWGMKLAELGAKLILP